MRTFLTLLLCLSALTSMLEAQSPMPDDETLSTNRPTHETDGKLKFQMLPYRDTLVLLDTDSGSTWLLQHDANSDAHSWSKISWRESTAVSSTALHTGISVADVGWSSGILPFTRPTVDPEIRKESFREWMRVQKELREIRDSEK